MKKQQEEKPKKKIVILFNAEEINLIIASACIMKRYKDASIIPVTAKTIGNWKEIESGVHSDIASFWRDRKAEIEDISVGEPEFYIIGIFPQDIEEMESLFNFCENNSGNIKLWTDDHWWPEFKHLKVLRRMCRNLIVCPNRTILDIVKQRGFFVPGPFIYADYALSTGEDAIMTNDLAFRITSAISVGKAMESLTRKQSFIPIIYLLIGEMVYNSHHREIEKMAGNFTDMINRTVAAGKRIKPYGDNPYRPIGYLDMGKVPEYTDVLGVIEEGLERYPWLCAVSANGHLFTASAEIPELGEILAGYKNLDDQTLLKVLAGEVKTYGSHQHDPKEFEL